jgi:hypothetical protein
MNKFFKSYDYKTKGVGLDTILEEAAYVIDSSDIKKPENYEKPFTEPSQNGIYELFQTDYDGTFYNEGAVKVFNFKYEKEDEVVLPMEFPLGNLYLINGVKTFVYNSL